MKINSGSMGLERARSAQQWPSPPCQLMRCALGWQRVFGKLYSLCRVRGCSCSRCFPWCSSSAPPSPSTPPLGPSTPVTSPPGSCSCSWQMQGPLYPGFWGESVRKWIAHVDIIHTHTDLCFNVSLTKSIHRNWELQLVHYLHPM